MPHAWQGPRTQPDDDAGGSSEDKPDRYPIEARSQRNKELAGERELPQSRQDGARRRQVARQEAGTTENVPSHQRRDRQDPVLHRRRIDPHASSTFLIISIGYGDAPHSSHKMAHEPNRGLGLERRNAPSQLVSSPRCPPRTSAGLTQ